MKKRNIPNKVAGRKEEDFIVINFNISYGV
jgi:hypothetical protein